MVKKSTPKKKPKKTVPKKKRDYKKEYKNYHGKPEQKKRRSQRNTSRAKMEKAGKVKKGDGKDVHHKDGNTANQSMSNLSVVTQRFNRGSKNKKGATK